MILDIVSVVAFVLLALLSVLFYNVTLDTAAGAAISLGYALVYGVLALFQPRRSVGNLLTLASAASLATALVYITIASGAGDLCLLLQTLLLASVALNVLVPPL